MFEQDLIAFLRCKTSALWTKFVAESNYLSWRNRHWPYGVSIAQMETGLYPAYLDPRYKRFLLRYRRMVLKYEQVAGYLIGV